MTDFIVTSPEGTKYKVSAPPGKTEQDALAYVKQNHDQLKSLPATGAAGTPEAEAELGANAPRQADPVPFAEGDPNLSLKDIGQAGRGAISAIAGMPGDLEKTAMSAIGRGVNTFNKKVLGSPARVRPEPNILPTSDTVEKSLFAPPADEREKGYRTVGSIVGSTVAPGVAGAVGKEAVALPRQLIDLGSKIAPGATGRAVEKLTKIGLPDTPSTLGAKVHDFLTQKLTAAKNARAGETAQNVTNFTSKTDTVEPILNDYRSTVRGLLKERGKDLSSEEAALVQSSLRELHGDRSLVAIDKERRRLRDIANSGAFEGHSAIKKQFASELADKLTGIMQTRNESFGKYLSDYRAASEPINLYNKTALGKAATREGPSNISATDAALLPKRFFNSAQSVSVLKKLAGDDDFVDAAARIHAASEMERLTAGQSIDGAAKRTTLWVRQNKGWLDELPDVKADAEKYAANLRKTGQTQKYAKTAAGAGAVGLLLAEGQKPYYWIRHLLGIP